MTQSPPETAERRRSQRIPLFVPLLVKSLDPVSPFYAALRTIEVSHHGCILSAPRPFKRDMQLRLDIPNSKRTTTARVVRSYPTGTHVETWKVALELNKPGNFWFN